MSRLPFPSNENTRVGDNAGDQHSVKTPWKRVNPSESPPIMFQVNFCDGRAISFAYCDLREMRLRDAGFLQLCLLGMEKYHINIIGRNLTELANLIGAGRIKSFTELGPRTFELPEANPSYPSQEAHPVSRVKKVGSRRASQLVTYWHTPAATCYPDCSADWIGSSSLNPISQPAPK